MSKFSAFLLAARPKTLPAAFVPVIIGSAAAISVNQFKLLPALVALICSILIQIGTNFVNDLYDYLRGSDTKKRVGPKRALASGLLSVTEMKIAIFITFSLTFLLGLFLVFKAGWIILLVGILSIAAGFSYTAGPYPLAYNALGDIFVIIFFGFVGTIGTYYVQTLEVSPVVVWASIPVGALITNILVINNYRDVEQDKEAGKITLAVKYGRRFARIEYIILLLVSYLTPVVIYIFYIKSLYILLPLISIPIAINQINSLYKLTGSDLNYTLEKTAKLSALFGVLFSIGFVI